MGSFAVLRRMASGVAIYVHGSKVGLMKIARRLIGVFALVMSLSGVGSLHAEESKLLIRSGDKIAFMGDSITQAGNRKGGYVTLVMDALNREGLGVTHLPAGISGHKSSDMLLRIDRDVIEKKPDWMVLSCGVNDVWHFTLQLGKRTFEGVALEDYQKNITAMIEKAEKAGIKVLVLTSTMIGEDPEKETNQKLIPYNEFLRKIAKEKGLPLADLNREMQVVLEGIPDEEGKARMFGEPNYDRKVKNKLTTDGCHMNALGNIMMAKGILKTLGLGADQIAAAEKVWLGK